MKLLKTSALALLMSFVFASCSDMNMDDLMDDLRDKNPDHTEQPGDHDKDDGNTGGGNDDGNTGGGNDNGNTGGGNDGGNTGGSDEGDY